MLQGREWSLGLRDGWVRDQGSGLRVDNGSGLRVGVGSYGSVLRLRN